MSIGSRTHEEFMEEARAFHGYPAPGLIIGGYMVELAKRHMPEGVLYDAVSETAHCLPDAVQLLTPCTFGNGWLRVLPFGIYAVTLYDKATGEGVRVELDNDKLEPYDAIRSWFLKERPKKEQDTERLQAQIKEAGESILSFRKVRIRQDMLGHRSFGAITRCPLCGSHYPASYGGICRSCQGQSPYEDGPGFALSQQPRMPAPVPIPVEEAVGKHALHDMTQIIPGKEKGAAFVAGQELSAGDICRLQQMGKNRVYVQENTPHPEGWVHEDDAARGFARLMPGDGVEVEAAPREGKVNFRATRDGMLLVDTERLERFNLVPDVMYAPQLQRAHRGDAACRKPGHPAVPVPPRVPQGAFRFGRRPAVQSRAHAQGQNRHPRDRDRSVSGADRGPFRTHHHPESAAAPLRGGQDALCP